VVDDDAAADVDDNDDDDDDDDDSDSAKRRRRLREGLRRRWAGSGAPRGKHCGRPPPPRPLCWRGAPASSSSRSEEVKSYVCPCPPHI